ncbi:hypothetical protein RCL52_23815, partial [Salmonella enterica subsp. enterica serovar Rissen]
RTSASRSPGAGTRSGAQSDDYPASLLAKTRALNEEGITEINITAALDFADVIFGKSDNWWVPARPFFTRNRPAWRA